MEGNSTRVTLFQGEVTEEMLPYHLQAERLAAGTYYDSGTLAAAVTMSGAGPDQRGQQPIQVTAAAPHSRADHINSSPMLRTTGKKNVTFDILRHFAA